MKIFTRTKIILWLFLMLNNLSLHGNDLQQVSSLLSVLKTKLISLLKTVQQMPTTSKQPKEEIKPHQEKPAENQEEIPSSDNVPQQKEPEITTPTKPIPFEPLLVIINEFNKAFATCFQAIDKSTKGIQVYNNNYQTSPEKFENNFQNHLRDIAKQITQDTPLKRENVKICVEQFHKIFKELSKTIKFIVYTDNDYQSLYQEYTSGNLKNTLTNLFETSTFTGKDDKVFESIPKDNLQYDETIDDFIANLLFVIKPMVDLKTKEKKVNALMYEFGKKVEKLLSMKNTDNFLKEINALILNPSTLTSNDCRGLIKKGSDSGPSIKMLYYQPLKLAHPQNIRIALAGIKGTDAIEDQDNEKKLQKLIENSYKSKQIKLSSVLRDLFDSIEIKSFQDHINLLKYLVNNPNIYKVDEAIVLNNLSQASTIENFQEKFLDSTLEIVKTLTEKQNTNNIIPFTSFINRLLPKKKIGKKTTTIVLNNEDKNKISNYLKEIANSDEPTSVTFITKLLELYKSKKATDLKKSIEAYKSDERKYQTITNITKSIVDDESNLNLLYKIFAPHYLTLEMAKLIINQLTGGNDTKEPKWKVVINKIHDIIKDLYTNPQAKQNNELNVYAAYNAFLKELYSCIATDEELKKLHPNQEIRTLKEQYTPQEFVRLYLENIIQFQDPETFLYPKDIEFFITRNAQVLKTISENFGQFIEKSKTQTNRYKELGAQEIPPSSNGMTVLLPPQIPEDNSNMPPPPPLPPQPGFGIGTSIFPLLPQINLVKNDVEIDAYAKILEKYQAYFKQTMSVQQNSFIKPLWEPNYTDGDQSSVHYKKIDKLELLKLLEFGMVERLTGPVKYIKKMLLTEAGFVFDQKQAYSKNNQERNKELEKLHQIMRSQAEKNDLNKFIKNISFNWQSRAISIPENETFTVEEIHNAFTNTAQKITQDLKLEEFKQIDKPTAEAIAIRFTELAQEIIYLRKCAKITNARLLVPQLKSWKNNPLKPDFKKIEKMLAPVIDNKKILNKKNTKVTLNESPLNDIKNFKKASLKKTKTDDRSTLVINKDPLKTN